MLNNMIRQDDPIAHHMSHFKYNVCNIFCLVIERVENSHERRKGVHKFLSDFQGMRDVHFVFLCALGGT